jgi:hypothetical protein
MRSPFRVFAPLALALILLAPAGPATAAPADTVRFDAIFSQVNDCNDETLELEVTYHGVSKLQKDGTYITHVTIHGQGRGSRGNAYVLQLNSQERSASTDYSFVERVRLISKGSTPNQVLITRYDPETGLLAFEAECRGDLD